METTEGSGAPTLVATLLLMSWAAIGIGAAINNGRYAPGAILLVGSGTLGVLLSAIVSRTELWAGRSSSQIGLVAAAGAALVGALAYPAGFFGYGHWLTTCQVLVAAIAALLLGWLILSLPRPILGASLAIGIAIVAGVAMILSSPRPAIDDWYMLQATAHGLSQGQDIYLVRWSGPPGEAANLFAYLPGSALLLWPFHALFGDVRYGDLAALIGTACVLVWVGRRSWVTLVACLVLVYPRAMFGIEQSWVDPLVLLALCVAAACVAEGRTAWSVVAFAVALSCKQQAWLVLPMACVWRDFGWRRTAGSVGLAVGIVIPWALVAPSAFLYDVFRYQLQLPIRLDSLSLLTTFHQVGIHLGLGPLLASTAAGIGIALWRVPRSTFGFFLGAALVMAVFNLTNKQSFYNEWELTAGLVLAAVVFRRSPRPAQAVASGWPAS